MKYVTSLAIDLAKNVFQLYGTNSSGKAVLKKRLYRTKLIEFVSKLNSCDIYMEGCSSANYWGRIFERMGHKVKLINPMYLASAQSKLHNYHHNIPMTVPLESQKQMFIVQPFSGRDGGDWMSTHPSLEKRLVALIGRESI